MPIIIMQLQSMTQLSLVILRSKFVAILNSNGKTSQTKFSYCDNLQPRKLFCGDIADDENRQAQELAYGFSWKSEFWRNSQM